MRTQWAARQALTCTHPCMQPCVHACTLAHTRASMQAHARAHTSPRMHTHTRAQTHTQVCTRFREHTRTRRHTRTHRHTRAHTSTHACACARGGAQAHAHSPHNSSPRADPLPHPDEPAGQGAAGQVVLHLQPEGARQDDQGDDRAGAVAPAAAVQLCGLARREAHLQALRQPILCVRRGPRRQRAHHAGGHPRVCGGGGGWRCSCVAECLAGQGVAAGQGGGGMGTARHCAQSSWHARVRPHTCTHALTPPTRTQVLDRYFGNVCELDLIFNFHKAYYILDELLIAGGCGPITSWMSCSFLVGVGWASVQEVCSGWASRAHIAAASACKCPLEGLWTPLRQATVDISELRCNRLASPHPLTPADNRRAAGAQQARHCARHDRAGPARPGREGRGGRVGPAAPVTVVNLQPCHPAALCGCAGRLSPGPGSGA